MKYKKYVMIIAVDEDGRMDCRIINQPSEAMDKAVALAREVSE